MGRSVNNDAPSTTGTLRRPLGPFRGDKVTGGPRSAIPDYYGIEMIWQCAKCFAADGNSGPSTPEDQPTAGAHRAVGLLKNKTTESTSYAKHNSELRTLMQLPGNFSILTHMAKIDAMRRSGAPLHLRNEFLANGAKLNILRSVQGSLRSAASGINNYIRFCTMADSTAPPPSSGSIRRWGTTSDPGKTFGLYINHVRMASIILGREDAWLTPEVRLIARVSATPWGSATPKTKASRPQLYNDIRCHAYSPRPGAAEQHGRDCLHLIPLFAHVPLPRPYNLRPPTQMTNF